MRRMRDEADMEGKSHYTACSRGSLGPDLFLTGLAQRLQLGDVHRDPQRTRRCAENKKAAKAALVFED